MSRYAFTTFPAHAGAVMELSAIGSALLSTSMDHTARVYDLVGSEPPRLRHVLPHEQPLRCGSLSNEYAATGGDDGALATWNARSGARERVFEGHTKAVVFVAWRGAELVSASHDGTIRRWDPDTGACLEVIDGFAGSKAHLSTEGVLCFSATGEVIGVDLVTKSRRVLAPSDGDELTAFALAGRRLVVSYAEVSNSPSPPFRWARAVDIITGAGLPDRFEAGDGLWFSADGSRALTELWDTLTVVDEADAKCRLSVAPVRGVRSAAFAPHGGIVLGGADGPLAWGVRATGA